MGEHVAARVLRQRMVKMLEPGEAEVLPEWMVKMFELGGAGVLLEWMVEAVKAMKIIELEEAGLWT